MFGSADSARGAPFPARGGGVWRTLSSRTQSSRSGERVYRGRDADGHCRPSQSTLAAGRIAELLRACCVISGSAEMWNRTGLAAATLDRPAAVLTLSCRGVDRDVHSILNPIRRKSAL